MDGESGGGDAAGAAAAAAALARATEAGALPLASDLRKKGNQLVSKIFFSIIHGSVDQATKYTVKIPKR